MKPLSFSNDPFTALTDWEFAPTFREKTRIEGIDVYLCGMLAKHPQWGEVVGSSANLGSSPDNNAWYELVERISIVQAMQKSEFTQRDPISDLTLGTVAGHKVFPTTKDESSQFSKSNGIALFSNWPEACRRACFELVERHLVLASWLGLSKPLILSGIESGPLQSLAHLYEIIHIGFGQQKVSTYEGDIFASGVLLRPRDSKYPLVLSFGAGQSLAESVAKAQAEAWQRLGFLWGEDLPEIEPDFSPTHLYHQDYYLFTGHHSKIDEWISGGHWKGKQSSLPSILNMTFVDLSSPQTLHFRVAKAMAPEAIPLVFGKWKEGLFSDLEAKGRLIHPIA